MTEGKTNVYSRRAGNTLDNWSTLSPSDIMTTSAAAAVVSSAELDLLDTFTLSETGGGKQAPTTAPTPSLAFGTMDDLDYSVISSAQTIENVFGTFLSERSASIAEEGGNSNNDVLDTDNSTQATNPQSAPTSSSQQQQQPDAYSNGSMGAALEDHHRQYQNQHYQHQRPRQESFASINSTATTEPLPQFQINQPHHPSGMPRSRPVSIPQPSSSYQQQQHAPMTTSSTSAAAASGTVSQASSAGSSGSAFLNNILNPAATTTNTGFTIMAHTPPTYIATSYEASHFGKRPRANVSILSSIFSVVLNVGTVAGNSW
jgi:hypothetical protein